MKIECDDCGGVTKVDILRGLVEPHYLWIMTSDGPRQTGAVCGASNTKHDWGKPAQSVVDLLSEISAGRVWVTEKGIPRLTEGHLIRKRLWEIASEAGWIRMHGDSPVVTASGKSWAKQS